MTRNLVLVSLLLIGATSAYGQFFEDWDDGNAATRWSAPIETLENPNIAFDGNVDYAYDYSVLGIPSAPNSVGGTTIGVGLETNLTLQTDDTEFEGEGVGIVPLMGDLPDGDFRLTADAYMFWNFESGSTEYLTIGIHSGGTAAPVRFNIDNGDGLAWQFDGEGGSGTDILRFEGPNGSETGLGGWEDFDCATDPFNVGTGCYPGNQVPGPVNRWIEVMVESIGGTVTLSVSGLEIDSYDNTAGNFSGGTLMLGQSDPFDSVNPDDANGNSNIVVFDNVRVTVIPEPSSGLLLMLALGGLGIRRRRLTRTSNRHSSTH